MNSTLQPWIQFNDKYVSCLVYFIIILFYLFIYFVLGSKRLKLGQQEFNEQNDFNSTTLEIGVFCQQQAEVRMDCSLHGVLNRRVFCLVSLINNATQGCKWCKEIRSSCGNIWNQDIERRFWVKHWTQIHWTQ